MRIADFKLERFFAAHEFSVRHLLSASDCESLSQRELLALADDETLNLWDDLHLGYTESAGHPLLRHEIAGMYETLTAADVLVAAPEEAIFVAMNTLLAPGDHVIATFPGYQSLYEIAQAVGCTVTRWPLAHDGASWRLDLDRLEESITPRTRLLVINFPHNPTGYLPTLAEWQAILRFAIRHSLFIFSDEMYRLLEHDPADRLPAACDLYERAISLSGLSKAFALPGLRIGWLATRDRELLARLAAFKDYTTICSSAPSEILGIMALRARRHIIARNLAIVQANVAAAGSFFGAHPELFRWLPPRAGSVAFPQFVGSGGASAFCAGLLAQRSVLLLPGAVFDFGDDHFRVGLGRASFAAGLAELAEYCS